MHQQSCVSKSSSACQKSDSGGYYKWTQRRIVSSQGFSREVASKKPTIFLATGPETSAESGFALMCPVKPKIRNWDDLVQRYVLSIRG